MKHSEISLIYFLFSQQNDLSNLKDTPSVIKYMKIIAQLRFYPHMLQLVLSSLLAEINKAINLLQISDFSEKVSS